MIHTIKPVFLGLFGLCSLAFVSCKKDIVETPPAATDGNAKSSVEAVDASYYPINNGSASTYVDSTIIGSARVTKSAIKVAGDTTIDGKTFSKTSAANSKTSKFYNSTEGVTTLVSYNGNDKIITTVLKANEAVGAVWKDVFTNSGVPTTYEWKMVAKGLSKTVEGVTYSNVIQVHLLGTAETKTQGKVVFANSDYFYAPNVGLIENIAYNPTTGKTEFHRSLQKTLTP